MTKQRLVTRSDVDGLVCAILLKELNLIDEIVFVGFVMAWRRARRPTSRSPVSVKATTDGVIRSPSELVMTVGEPPSRTATQENVVPKSMPIIFSLIVPPSLPAPDLGLP